MKVAIWDADFIMWYVCHNKKGDPIKTLEDCKRLTDEFINNVNANIYADYYIITLTVGKCFRYDIYKDYKANRKKIKLSNKPQYLDNIKEYLITKYNANYAADKYEADDLVCIYKRLLTNHGYDCVIVSPDKDILNLEGTHYNPKINEFVYTSAKDAKKYFWKSMLKGDSADGLIGCYGIGESISNDIIEHPNRDIYEDYHQVVLNQYFLTYGEELGVDMFYKMYKCLKMVNVDDNIDKPNMLKLSKEACEQEKDLFE